MEEGEEEPEGASPHASSYVPGDSTTDLPGLAAGGAEGSQHQPAESSMLPNGAAQHAPRSPRGSRPNYFSQGPGSSTEHGRHTRSAKLPRHRVRAAVRRAPQYALEGALGLMLDAWAGLPCGFCMASGWDACAGLQQAVL